MADIATLALKVENGDVVKATASLEGMTVAGGKTEAATQRLTRRMALLEIEARKMDAALEQTGRSSFRLTDGMGGLASAMQAVAGALAVREVLAMADAYTNLHSRLRLVTSGAAELAGVEARLFATSQATRTSLESNVALYASLARSTKSLGLSQADLEGITKTVAQAFGVSGASASETAGAIRQLSQAMASGVLRGDEFNSIAENAPRLQQAVAESLGVTNGQLRAMAAEGKITSDVLANALLKSAEKINAEFQTMPPTVGGAMEQIKNAMLVGVGAIDGAQGSTAGLATALTSLADAIPGIASKLNAFFGGIQLAALDARIAVENMADAIRTSPWQTLKGLVAGAMGNTRGALEAGVQVASNSEMAELLAAREKLRAQLATLLAGTTALTGATTTHGHAIATVTQLTDAQRKAAERLAEKEHERNRDLRFANLQVDLANQVAASDKKRTETATALAAALAGVAAQTERIRNAQVGRDADAAERAAHVQFVEDMKVLWREGAGEIAAGFVKSMARGFEEVYELAVKMMARMEKANKASGAGYAALKYGAAAISGGLAGYATGNVPGGAVMGALAGSSMGPWGAVIGGLSGAVGGLLGASKAQREAAENMRRAAEQLRLSVSGYAAGADGDQLKQALIADQVQYEALRQAILDQIAVIREANRLGVGPQRSDSDWVNRLDELDAAHRKIVEKMTQEAADAKAIADAQAAIQAAEARRIDDRRQEDAALRIMAATNDPLLEASRIAAEQRREIEDLVAAKASEATIALTKQAQAAEDVARATAAATAAMEKAAAQARAVEDINIELLRARGDENGAFAIEQRLRLEDAQKNQSAEYVEKLLELQQLQRDQRAAQQLIDSTATQGSGGGYGGGSTSAGASVSAVVTDRTALALVDLTRTGVSQRSTMISLLRSIDRKTGGSSGGSIQSVDEGLGSQQSAYAIFSGSVSR